MLRQIHLWICLCQVVIVVVVLYGMLRLRRSWPLLHWHQQKCRHNSGQQVPPPGGRLVGGGEEMPGSGAPQVGSLLSYTGQQHYVLYYFIK